MEESVEGEEVAEEEESDQELSAVLELVSLWARARRGSRRRARRKIAVAARRWNRTWRGRERAMTAAESATLACVCPHCEQLPSCPRLSSRGIVCSSARCCRRCCVIRRWPAAAMLCCCVAVTKSLGKEASLGSFAGFFRLPQPACLPASAAAFSAIKQPHKCNSKHEATLQHAFSPRTLSNSHHDSQLTTSHLKPTSGILSAPPLHFSAALHCCNAAAL